MSINEISDFTTKQRAMDSLLPTKRIAQIAGAKATPRDEGRPAQKRTSPMSSGAQSNAVAMLMEYAASQRQPAASRGQPVSTNPGPTEASAEGASGAVAGEAVSDKAMAGETEPEGGHWTVLYSDPEISDKNEITEIRQVYEDGTVVIIRVTHDKDGLDDSDGAEMDILSIKTIHGGVYKDSGTEGLITRDPVTDKWTTTVPADGKPRKNYIEEDGFLNPIVQESDDYIYVGQYAIIKDPEILPRVPVMLGNSLQASSVSNMHMIGYETPESIRDPLEFIMPASDDADAPASDDVEKPEPVIEPVEGFDEGTPDRMTFQVQIPRPDAPAEAPITVFVHVDREVVADMTGSDELVAERIVEGIGKDLGRMDNESLLKIDQKNILLTDLPDGQDVQYGPEGGIILDAGYRHEFGGRSSDHEPDIVTMKGHDILQGAIGGMTFDQMFGMSVTPEWLEAMEEDSQRAGTTGISISKEAAQDPEVDIREAYVLWRAIETGRITGSASEYFKSAFSSRFAFFEANGM